MKRVLIIGVLLSTLLVLINVYWWLKCALTLEGFENVLEEYLSVFPSVIAKGRVITYLSLALITVNIGVLIFLLIKGRYSILSVFLLSINALIFVWTVFTLM